MSIDQNNIRKYDDEFDFSQLFIAIWKNRILIICITLIASIITGLYTFVIVKPTYSTKLNIILNMPETYLTEFGDYTLPITTNQEYINLLLSNTVLANTITDMEYKNTTIEDLKESIKLGNIITTPDVEQNYYEVSISSKKPKDAAKLAKMLYKNYKKFLDVITVESFVSYYYDKFSTEIDQLKYRIDSNNALLKENESLLSTIPQTINHEEALRNLNSQINGTDILLMGDVTNPNYTDTEKSIITIKQQVLTDKNTINTDTVYIKQLKTLKQSIDQYYATSEIDSKLEKSSLAASGVSMPSAPVVPSRKDASNNIKKIILGTLIGVVIGCITAFIKFYVNKLNKMSE